MVLVLLGYLLVFGLLTWQDQSNAAVTLPYTQFTAQIDAKNVGEIFARGDTIEGTLRAPRPVPDQPGRTYQQFTTERPCGCPKLCTQPLTCCFATSRRPA